MTIHYSDREAEAAMRAARPVSTGASSTPPGASAILHKILLSEPRTARPRRRRRRRVKLAVLGAGIAVAALILGVVGVPGHGPGVDAAFAVSATADGVELTALWPQHPDPAAIQASLVHHGVRAVVLTESAPGICHAPHATQVGDPSLARVLQILINTPDKAVYLLRPEQLPENGTLVVLVVSVQPPNGARQYAADMWVALGTPPQCGRSNESVPGPTDPSSSTPHTS